ncbi:hypothetical protein [Salinigranum sp. GCM10025319]|uniref:hypothetical protein n=1 Tax=Salinigranum sp. GCM10025319 TaxID=3252687 RepID=UPI00361BB47F
MPSRFVGLLGSYDVFGKAVPGLVVFLGFVSLLPNDSPLLNLPGRLTIGNIAVIVLVSIIVGLVFGEGVHNIAINIERSFSKLSSWAEELNKALKNIKSDILLWWNNKEISIGSRTSTRNPSDHKDDSDETGVGDSTSGDNQELAVPPEDLEGDRKFKGIYPLDVLRRFRKWGTERLEKFSISLIDHRELFRQHFLNQLSPYRNPEDRSQLPFRYFLQTLSDQYDLDPSDYEHIDEMYTLITSRIDADVPTRAQGFQVRYSFCRSMWVVLGFFTTIYSVLFIHRDFESIVEAVQDIPEDAAGLAVSHQFVTMVVFGILSGMVIGSLYDLGHQFRGRNQHRPSFYYVVGATGISTVVGIVIAVFTSIPSKVIYYLFFTIALILSMVIHFTEWFMEVVEYWIGSEIIVENLVFFSLHQNLEVFIIALIGVATVAFYDASGDYKQYYIEYLLADLVTGGLIESGSSRGNGEESDDEDNGEESDDESDENNGGE